MSTLTLCNMLNLSIPTVSAGALQTNQHRISAVLLYSYSLLPFVKEGGLRIPRDLNISLFS